MLIDCDIHPALPSSAALLPYLDDHWKEQVTTRGIDGLSDGAKVRTAKGP